MAKKTARNSEAIKVTAATLLDSVSLFPRQLIQMDSFIRECGLPLSQIQIMVSLAQGDASIGALSGMLGIAKPNVTPLVDALSEKGYAVRVPSTEDRRMVNVHLTEAGAEKLNMFREALERQIENWTDDTRNDMNKLNHALTTVNDFIRNH